MHTHLMKDDREQSGADNDSLIMSLLYATSRNERAKHFPGITTVHRLFY